MAFLSRDIIKQSRLFIAIFLIFFAVIYVFWWRYFFESSNSKSCVTSSSHISPNFRIISDSRIKATSFVSYNISLTFNVTYVEENLNSLDQRDPQLIEYTRVRHLTPPSKLPYNLKSSSGDFKDTFSGWVAKFFKNKRNGIFIECGANEGEHASHSLYLEKELGWTGLLIECNPTVAPYLRSKHRKAWIADVCLSPTSQPATLNFSNPTNWTNSGTLGNPWNLPVPTKWTFFDVQAIPLYTILASLGWTEIDYFGFDIEGQEFNVLKAFPFELIKFKVLIIEVYFYSYDVRVELHEFLLSKGYVFVKDMEVDKIYVHENYQEMIPSTWFFK